MGTVDARTKIISRLLHFILWTVLGTAIGAALGLLAYAILILWPGFSESQRNAIIPAFAVLGFMLGMYGFISAILHDRASPPPAQR